MLVLTRHAQQKIMIGDHIQIMVLSIYQNQVHLGIQAPRQIAVHRQEVYLRIQEKNQQTYPTYPTYQECYR